MYNMKTYLKIELGNNTHGGRDLDCEIGFLTGEFSDYRSRNYMNDYNVNNEYQPKMGDTFYFLPGVTVPRVKLKDLQAEYKIKTVRDLESASVVFVGDKTFSKIIDNTWVHYCNTIHFKEFIESAKANGHIDDYYYGKLVTALEFYTEDRIITEWPTNRTLSDRDYSYHLDNSVCSMSSVRFDSVVPEYENIFTKLNTVSLYTDASLMPYINGADAVTIDAAMYQTLSDMFKSSDRDNYVIAMEIMANCNYFDSLAYLSLLFYHYGSRIEDQPTKNHVNFKTLRNYFGFDRGYCHLDEDNCIKQMIDKDAVTVDNMGILLNEFNNVVKTYGDKTYLRVKQVAFSDEIDNLLNQEMLVTTKADYKPETTQVNESTNTTDIFF